MSCVWNFGSGEDLPSHTQQRTSRRGQAAVRASEMSSVKASLEAIYNMFRDEDGSGVSRNKCKAFLWSAGHEVEDESHLDHILSRYTDAAGKGKDGSVAMSVEKEKKKSAERMPCACQL